MRQLFLRVWFTLRSTPYTLNAIAIAFQIDTRQHVPIPPLIIDTTRVPRHSFTHLRCASPQLHKLHFRSVLPRQDASWYVYRPIPGSQVTGSSAGARWGGAEQGRSQEVAAAGQCGNTELGQGLREGGRGGGELHVLQCMQPVWCDRQRGRRSVISPA